MTTEPIPMLLIPGARMGAWPWNDTVARLREAGRTAHTLTLSELESGASADDLTRVRLDGHVAEALRAVRAIGRPLTIVVHSCSGLIAGRVADRAPERVVHPVLVAGLYLREGRRLLDDRGSGATATASERAASPTL